MNTSVNKINSLSLFYQYIKQMIIQYSLYILGILNLILASTAIFCVIEAEDQPEYFSLIYIVVSIFSFYMAIIILIIILQIIETYREQHENDCSSLSIQIPVVTSPKSMNQTNLIVTKHMEPKTQIHTCLSHSQTLPLATATTRLESLAKYHTSVIHKPKTGQLLGLIDNEQLCPTYEIVTNSDRNSSLSSFIKPLPQKWYK